VTMDAALFPQAFEAAHDAFIVLDAAGAVTGWSASAQRLYGYAAAEVTGRTLEFLRIAGEPSGPAALALLMDGPRERIVRQRHRSGRELQVSLRIAAPAGQAGLLLCAADVSRQRQAEAELAGSRVSLEASRAELRRVIGRLVTAEEEARRRISQELHDDLCQRLAGIALGLKAVRRQLPEGDARRLELDSLGGGLGEAAEDLRRLSHDLHPAILERRGLAAALHDHCEEVERRCSLPVRLTLRGIVVRDPAVSLPPPLVLGLYRIAQEALANAVRHAGARDIQVTLEVEEGAVYLSVVDDGAGFEPDEVRRTGGLGLAGIEERAQLLGGRCRIASATGAGTEVRVFVPRPAAAPAGPAGPAEAGDPRPPRIGPYQVLSTIGTGSMATVYLAQEPEPLGRQVALKLHRAPLPGRWATLRFRAEQQALARLHHPAIAQVYEAGATADDDLYIAMEYVPGLPITQYCDRYGLSLRQRLELFAAVCGGVQHAHQKGVLHRDLKPSHILVAEATMVGIRPHPKIIGFGAAKGLDRPLTDGTVWGAEALVGTPAYLSPEALGGGETDARSDVYSLGVVLYELLAGAVPLGGGEPGRGDLVPPSQRSRTLPDAAGVARCRGFAEPSKLRRRLAGDLDRLVLKALAADPADRYPTVEALGREIGRVVRGTPVEAGPPGALHRFRRVLRRHRRLVATAVLVILALGGGLAATIFETRRTAREAARADAAARFLEDLFKASDPRQARGEPPTARELLRRGTDRLGRELHDQPLLRARLLDTLGGIHTSLGLFPEARPLLAEALAIRERLRGPAHLEVAETLVRLGALARLSGQGDAVPLFQRALAIREARLGSASPEVAEVLNDLGTAFAAQGRFDEAGAILRRTLALQERVLGSHDPRVAKTLHNLAGIAYYRHRPADAEQLLQRALAVREAALAPDDPDLAGSLEALALLRQGQGRLVEAAQLLERQVPIVEKVYGPGHPELARALLNLGLVRKDLGEDTAARQLFERALAIQEKTVSPVHPELVRTLAALADLHCGHARYAEAEPLFRRLLKLRDQGAVFDQWNQSLASWARLLRATGREDEAARVAAR
jgi:eukaryotic-like serine/threonine-protein kinase